MTAQAGAVAAWVDPDDLADMGEYGVCLDLYPNQIGDAYVPLYRNQPAAVSVEALEGLVEALRNEAATIAKPYGFVTEHIIGKAEGLESCAERIERLFKERSNG